MGNHLRRLAIAIIAALALSLGATVPAEAHPDRDRDRNYGQHHKVKKCTKWHYHRGFKHRGHWHKGYWHEAKGIKKHGECRILPHAHRARGHDHKTHQHRSRYGGWYEVKLSADRCELRHLH